ncbi:peptidase M23 [Pseudoxanthomonas kalamensis DSM 18571]|uniref:murein hydrolase activator EnvC family protein n=1 Tax=Pseudoxanthomonas kalamensis TaxID=289483 RepID=UPI0013910ACF|nr:peptidoglycan DD-metalloendopeptidase family protein [Pseudoxanthomonas kalamensis]KAF1712174.1 peptidase M23 [Pseudoxanthomonas kalamensis DSM 18571]
MTRSCARSVCLALLAIALAAPWVAPAQNTRDTQKKLERVRGELNAIARERRKLEGERGQAARELRRLDEQVGKSARSLAETEAALRREQVALDEARERSERLQGQLQLQRAQLATLVRAAYMQGDNPALKALLSQDTVADAGIVLTYHRYLQRDRSQQIAALTGQLQDVQTLQAEIESRQAELETIRQRQRGQATELEKDRKARASLVGDLDQRYRDRQQREKALGQDARSLERLLANLRAAAARAEAERRAAERAAAQSPASEAGGKPATKVPPKVASAPAPKVGGLGWPLSGSLLARYGARMPDGRNSTGLLIGAPQGSPVTAVADGTVVFSEWMTGYGLILIIDHGNGYMSLYAHNETLLRDAGDTVKRGDAVARVGSSGGQGTSALYFELRRNGQPVDPASWLQRR